MRAASPPTCEAEGPRSLDPLANPPMSDSDSVEALAEPILPPYITVIVLGHPEGTWPALQGTACVFDISSRESSGNCTS